MTRGSENSLLVSVLTRRRLQRKRPNWALAARTTDSESSLGGRSVGPALSSSLRTLPSHGWGWPPSGVGFSRQPTPGTHALEPQCQCRLKMVSRANRNCPVAVMKTPCGGHKICPVGGQQRRPFRCGASRSPWLGGWWSGQVGLGDGLVAVGLEPPGPMRRVNRLQSGQRRSSRYRVSQSGHS